MGVITGMLRACAVALLTMVVGGWKKDRVEAAGQSFDGNKKDK